MEDFEQTYQSYMKYVAFAVDKLPRKVIENDKNVLKLMETWNPLINTSDAIQLAISLGMMIDTDYNGSVAAGTTEYNFEDFQDDEEDKEAAIRRVIIRLAATIGLHKYNNFLDKNRK